MPALEFLAYEPTPLGLLCLRRRELVSIPGTIVTEVTLDNEFLMSSFLTDSERALTTVGLEMVVEERKPGEKIAVLVGGLGLGYTAAEALKSDRVNSVEVIEFLPEVIGWMKDGLVPLSPTINTDSRMTVTHEDVYARLTGPALQPVDLVLIDVDHSPEDVLGEQSHGFYTEAGLIAAREHLLPGGVLGVWSYAEDSPLLEKMKSVFRDVRVEQVTVMNELIREEQTDWLFFGRR